MILAFSAIFTHVAYADQPALRVQAASYILIEANSGRVLAGYDYHRQMFPASTTKAITSILVYEFIGMDEIVIAGAEVLRLPAQSARVGHEPGEAITGENLLRGMLIGPGNDTAMIAAMEVARRYSGNEEIGVTEGLQTFARLMTSRAHRLGAVNSNFVNPHGYHHNSHYTTAYDMAILTRHAMSIPDIARIAGEGSFAGYTAGDGDDAPASPFRRWNTANELLRDGVHGYRYATGFRTGFTNMAGQSMAAAAERDGIRLIAVTFDSPLREDGAPTRWADNITLFEYGFNNFAYRQIQYANGPIGMVYIYNPRLYDEGYLEFFTTQNALRFLSQAEYERITREIIFLPSLIAEPNGYEIPDEPMLAAPIEEGQTIGTVRYMLDGQVLFSSSLYAARYVPVRTVNSDVNYRWERFIGTFFSRAALPYWIAGLSVSLLAIVLIILIRNNIRRKKNRYFYKMKY